MSRDHPWRADSAFVERVQRRSLPAKTQPQPSARCADPPPGALLTAIAEFNDGQFFEQHETLEALWIQEADPVRYFYQGILQVGVGFYHWSRHNRHGTLTKLRQGLEKLQHYRPACMTVDVERFMHETQDILHALEQSPSLPEFPPPSLPKIHHRFTAG